MSIQLETQLFLIFEFATYHGYVHGNGSTVDGVEALLLSELLTGECLIYNVVIKNEVLVQI